MNVRKGFIIALIIAAIIAVFVVYYQGCELQRFHHEINTKTEEIKQQKDLVKLLDGTVAVLEKEKAALLQAQQENACRYNELEARARQQEADIIELEQVNNMTDCSFQYWYPVVIDLRQQVGTLLQQQGAGQ